MGNEVLLKKNVNEQDSVQEKDVEGLENDFDLKRPIEFEGNKIEKLILDFDALTGADLEKAEMQYTAESPQNALTMVKEMSKGYAAIVAAKAANVPVALIRRLSAPDYSKITMRTTLFLMNGK